MRREDGREIHVGDGLGVRMRGENPSQGDRVDGLSPDKTGHLRGAEDFVSGTEESSSRVKAQGVHGEQWGPLQWLAWWDQAKQGSHV